MSSSLLSCYHQAQFGHGLVFQVGYKVFVAVAVATVDTLSVHHSQFVVNLVVEQVTVNHQSHVTTVVHTMQGVRTLTSQKEYGLRVDVHQLEHGRRQGIFH